MTIAVAVGLVALVVGPGYIGGWASVVRAQHIPGADAVAAQYVPSHAAAFVAGSFGGGFGGLLAFVFGSVAFGSDYGWGTGATRVLHGSRRRATVLRRQTALALSLGVMALLAVGVALALSLVVSHPDFGLSMRPPTPAELARGTGVAWLLLAAWASLGMLSATLLRSGVAAMAVGVLYVMALETPIRNVAWHARDLIPVRNLTLDGLGHAASRLVHVTPAPEHADPLVAAAALGALAVVGACGTLATVMRQDM